MGNEVTLTEIKDLKRKLESTIRAEVNEFCEQSKVCIREVDIDLSEVKNLDGNRITIVNSVSIGLDI